MEHWRIISSLVFAISMVMAILHVCDAHTDTPGSTPEDFVLAHSCIRRALGLEPLCWDRKLAERAQAWANKRKDCQLIHSEGGGENMAYGYELNGSYATQLWIDERPHYDYATNNCLQMCGHYTQIVWNTTKKLGCGRAKCEPYDYPCYMIVCNYDPPGNYIGMWPY